MQSHVPNLPAPVSPLPPSGVDHSIAGVFVGTGVSLFGFLVLIILLA
jgi:hypothetical protein